MRHALVLAFAVVALVLVQPATAMVTQEGEPSTAVLAIGDFGVGGRTERATGTIMRRFEATHPADVLVTLGDNDYTESPVAFRRNWRAAFKWRRRAGVRVFGTLGNHDVKIARGRYEFRLLGMPRRYYARTVGNVSLFLLDSTGIDAAQTAWLRRTLAAATTRWKIAVLHHPPFTCGAYRSHPAVRARWVPLFERYGVQLVLSGHDHNYQRFGPRRGVGYVVHGGGATTYAIERCPAGYPRRRAAIRARGFLYLVAGAQRLQGTVVDRKRRIVDRFAVNP